MEILLYLLLRTYMGMTKIKMSFFFRLKNNYSCNEQESVTVS